MKAQFKLTDVQEEIANSLVGQNGIQRFNETSELGEAVKELNSDAINPDNKLSAIDTRTRLFPNEITLINQFDTLISIGLIPPELGVLTLTKKRLAVSLFGKSRSEMVEVIAGKRENDIRRGSIGGALSNFIGGK